MRATLLAISLLCSGAASAQPPERGPATSVYTNLDIDRCRVLEEVEEGGGAVWRCPGYGGIPLIVMAGDLRFDVDAGEDNGVFESRPGFNAAPERVEWRLRARQPRAIIYRIRLVGEGSEGRTLLGVETISRRGRWAGCLIAWIDGDVPNANAVARRIADRDNRRFRCGHSEPEHWTRRGLRPLE